MATRSTARPGVRLSERVEGLSDGLVSPVQAAALDAPGAASRIALAMGETFGVQSGLAGRKKANLEAGSRTPAARSSASLLQGEALVVAFTWQCAGLSGSHRMSGRALWSLGEVEEVLIKRPLALRARWGADQDIGALATDDAKLVAVVRPSPRR